MESSTVFLSSSLSPEESSSSTSITIETTSSSSLQTLGRLSSSSSSSWGNETKPGQEWHLSVAYTTFEGIVALLAIFGNALVAYVFCKNRGLRRYRNYYIFALAIADFLVGLLGIPFAVLASIGLPRNLHGCLFTVSLLMVLCTISILCLVAVSIDRYWATTNPFSYYRHMTTTTAIGIIVSCWIVGAIIGFLPLFGWYNHTGWYNQQHPQYCFFREVIDYNYLAFLYFVTIVFPAVLMGCFYGYIYHVVLIKIRQKGNLAPQMRRPSELPPSEANFRANSVTTTTSDGRQILKMIVSEKKREAKAAHKLGIIVLFFLICWMPLYTINCIQAFCRSCTFPEELWNFLVILSHANSSLNPLLYAYHLKEFRIAMKHALLQLLNKAVCGRLAERVEKEGGLCRTHTLPSLAYTAGMNVNLNNVMTTKGTPELKNVNLINNTRRGVTVTQEMSPGGLKGPNSCKEDVASSISSESEGGGNLNIREIWVEMDGIKGGSGGTGTCNITSRETPTRKD